MDIDKIPKCHINREYEIDPINKAGFEVIKLYERVFSFIDNKNNINIKIINIIDNGLILIGNSKIPIIKKSNIEEGVFFKILLSWNFS